MKRKSIYCWFILIFFNIFLFSPFITSFAYSAILPGDINGTGKVDLADAVIAFRICTGNSSSSFVNKDATINGDGRIGIKEAIYILQCVSGLRSCDKTPPEIISTTPANGANGVAANITITASFNETLDAATVNATTVTLKNSDGLPITGSVSCNGKTVQFIPSVNLATGTYMATITTGVKDLEGNGMPADHSWNFSTAAGIANGVLAIAPYPSNLIVKNGYLFFTNSSEIPVAKISITGEEITPLVRKTGDPENMAIRGQYIFWVDVSGGIARSGCAGIDVKAALRMSSLDGLSVKVLSEGDRCAWGTTTDIIVDATDVYWINSVANTYSIIKVPIAGGPSTIMASTLYRIRGLAGDATHIYWTEERWDDPGSLVKKMPKNGGEATELAAGIKALTGGLVQYGTDLFLADTNWGDEYRLIKVSTSGGPVTILANVVTGDSSNFVKSMYVSGDHVFWLDKDSVNSMPVSGGDVTKLFSGPYSPANIFVSGDSVLWTDTAGYYSIIEYGSIKKIPITGGAVTTLREGLENPGVIAIDASYIYWIEGGPRGTEGYGRIVKMPVGGGAAKTVAMAIDGGPLAVDDAYVYIANAGINKVPINGGLAERLVLGRVTNLVKDGNNVYCITQWADVYKVPIEGGTPVKLNSTFSGGPAGPIAVVNGFVYWMTRYDTIKKVPVGGGDETTIASNLPFLSDFVVDENNVYFSEMDTGNIRKVSVNGGPITTLANGLRGSDMILVLDNQNLYWIDQIHVGKVPVNGGSVSYIVAGGLDSDPYFPNSIAVDDTSVYWTETATGVIKKATPK